MANFAGTCTSDNKGLLLKIFVCVLVKKQSLLLLGCPEDKQINITFSFLGELFL